MTAIDMERRHIARPVELRAGTDGPGTLYGYASVYNKYSQNLGGFVEQVAPGAFADSLENLGGFAERIAHGAFSKSLADQVSVVARYNHDDNHLLGTTDAGTLRLKDDGTGLFYEVDLPETSSGRDVALLSKRGDLRYSSFAFHTLNDEWDVTERGFPLRTLKAVALIDVAPVNSPAYLDSSAGMRSLAERLDVEVEIVCHATTEELRSLILGEPIDIPAVEARSEEKEVETGQVENHPLADLYKRKLDLEQKR